MIAILCLHHCFQSEGGTVMLNYKPNPIHNRDLNPTGVTVLYPNIRQLFFISLTFEKIAIFHFVAWPAIENESIWHLGPSDSLSELDMCLRVSPHVAIVGIKCLLAELPLHFLPHCQENKSNFTLFQLFDSFKTHKR